MVKFKKETNLPSWKIDGVILPFKDDKYEILKFYKVSALDTFGRTKDFIDRQLIGELSLVERFRRDSTS